MTVPLGMIFDILPPSTWIPRESGVTSIKRIFLVASDSSPARIPP